MTNPLLDKDKFRRKVLLSLLSSPGTLVPALAGSSLLLGLWSFSLLSGPAAFVGIACLLGSAGHFLTRLMLGSEHLSKEAIEELQKEARAQRDAQLDALEARLVADGDPRTEACLRDLRALTLAVLEGDAWSAGLASGARFEILAGVQQLFERCVQSLDKSLRLWETAGRMTTAAARAPITAQRERIIADVQASIRQLSELLAGIEQLGAGAGSDDSELARIRQELAQNLQVARSVDQRMQAIESELRE